MEIQGKYQRSQAKEVQLLVAWVKPILEMCKKKKCLETMRLRVQFSDNIKISPSSFKTEKETNISL